MPVTVHAETCRLSQDEFGQIAYEVMGHAFAVHQEFGRFFDEEIYQHEIARRCGGATEVPVEVRHAGFQKVYFIDLLVGRGAPFELKAVTHLLGGAEIVLQEVAIVSHGQRIGSQKLRLAAPRSAFRFTAIRDEDRPRFADHLQRFLDHTSLEAMHWINVTNRLVTFQTLRQKN